MLVQPPVILQCLLLHVAHQPQAAYDNRTVVALMQLVILLTDTRMRDQQPLPTYLSPSPISLNMS